MLMKERHKKEQWLHFQQLSSKICDICYLLTIIFNTFDSIDLSINSVLCFENSAKSTRANWFYFFKIFGKP